MTPGHKANGDNFKSFDLLYNNGMLNERSDPSDMGSTHIILFHDKKISLLFCFLGKNFIVTQKRVRVRQRKLAIGVRVIEV